MPLPPDQSCKKETGLVPVLRDNAFRIINSVAIYTKAATKNMRQGREKGLSVTGIHLSLG